MLQGQRKQLDGTPDGWFCRELCPVVGAQQAEFMFWTTTAKRQLLDTFLATSFASEGKEQLGKQISLSQEVLSGPIKRVEKPKIVLDDLPEDYNMSCSLARMKASPRSSFSFCH